YQQFGQHLPLATLLQEPTVEHLASLLSQPTVTQSVSPVVPIQPFGSQSPFFCVHPIGGHVLCYEALARYLGEEQRFYGLQALGFNGEQEPLNSIELMATKYIAALREVQPQGPYQLGGWSLGGLIAWEMAQQLTDSGEEVALLALIDSYPPMAKPSDEPEDRATLLASIAQDLGGLYSKSLGVSVEQLRNLEEHQQLAVIVEAAKAAAIFPPEADFQQMYYWLQVFQANSQALHRYVPQPYIGKIVLFCAEESQKTTKGMMAWQQLALGGVEAYSIPGDHYTIIQDPQVQGLAKQLGLHLSFSKVESDFFQGRSIVPVG
ncbi:MAG: non-ribosomal peptide synthetase, partial [Moorea sp. SIO3G5]|nr:non-ribosomal peptide synthetase [Moorena sp. SIO3G5]